MNQHEFTQMLEKYADVILKVGLNLQKGQQLSLFADIQDTELVRLVTIRAYQMGARFVDVAWEDEKLLRIRFDEAQVEDLAEVPAWYVKFEEEHGERGDARLYIYSRDPDLLSGIPPESIATYRTALMKKLEPTFKYVDGNLINWNYVSTATPAWARKVFPELSIERAQERLWEAIFKACYIDLDDPIRAWDEHSANLHKRCQYLGEKKYAYFHYVAPGTDLTVGFPENNLWMGGSVKTPQGIDFFPNMPTEEIFTMPHKDKVNGVVSSTRPLNQLGVLIDKFTLTFENGRVIKATAKTGEEHLLKLIETDEYARQLGEVALISNSSPISQQNRLFYNTLFDENASCHLALGAAYRFSLAGGADLTKEEFMANGGNDSLIHTDFMIGSAQIDIDGIKEDGSTEPIMRNGEWAFDV